MAVVMQQLDRFDEEIEPIKSFRSLCLPESQDSLDNVLLELYKRPGRIEEEIEILQHKLTRIEGVSFGGKRWKFTRCQGRSVRVTVDNKQGGYFNVKEDDYTDTSKCEDPVHFDSPRSCKLINISRTTSLLRHIAAESKNFFSGSILEKARRRVLLVQRVHTSEGSIVHHRGRLQVTSWYVCTKEEITKLGKICGTNVRWQLLLMFTPH